MSYVRGLTRSSWRVGFDGYVAQRGRLCAVSWKRLTLVVSFEKFQTRKEKDSSVERLDSSLFTVK